MTSMTLRIVSMPVSVAGNGTRPSALTRCIDVLSGRVLGVDAEPADFQDVQVLQVRPALSVSISTVFILRGQGLTALLDGIER